MVTICECGARVQHDKKDGAICPACRVVLFPLSVVIEPVAPPLPLADDVAAENVVTEREVVWISASGKEYPEVVSVNVDPGDVIGETIKVGNVRIKVKGYR